jgi:hypothetical protein
MQEKRMNNKWWQRITALWQPSPIVPPTVDPLFPDMENVERAAESWRYNILSLEYWLSPNGALREYLRQVVRLSLPLGAPALLVIPIITFILASFLKWTVLLASIAWRTIVLMLVLLVGGVVTLFNWLMFKAFISSRR